MNKYTRYFHILPLNSLALFSELANRKFAAGVEDLFSVAVSEKAVIGIKVFVFASHQETVLGQKHYKNTPMRIADTLAIGIGLKSAIAEN